VFREYRPGIRGNQANAQTQTTAEWRQAQRPGVHR
jgi:hypothetical protein